MTITHETKVWGNDGEIILKTNRVERIMNKCKHVFDEKILYINTAKDFDLVERAVGKLIDRQGTIQYIYVGKYAQGTFDSPPLAKQSWRREAG